MFSKLWRFIRRADGPTAVEYAIMLALIVVLTLPTVRRIGNRSNTTFRTVAKKAGS